LNSTSLLTAVRLLFSSSIGLKHTRSLYLALLVIGAVPTAGVDSFIAGADFSHLAFFEQRGIVYREEGQSRDAMAILTNSGLTCVRLRLFTSSAAQAQANPYNAINNLDYTLPLAQRVKSAGLQFMLDFHYSDTWADPGKQTKPAAWTNLSFSDLKNQLRVYNSNCISTFKSAGAMPDYVQVGNEIIGGLLWPDGRVGGAYDTPAQWSRLGQLLTNAIAGIRDAAGAEMPRIIIHIDRGGDWGGTQWFFDHLLRQEVPFDLIGQSYYPFWHGSLESLGTCLTNTAQRYDQPVLIAETAFPWTNSASIHGLPATPEGQVQFTAALARIVRGLPGRKGVGVFWWGTEYQRLAGTSLAGFDQRSFFDFEGNVLPVAKAFGEMVAPVRLSVQPTEASTLSISWPLSASAHSLVTTTTLPPTVWLTVTNPVQTSGNINRTVIPIGTASNQFYRLESR